MSSEDEPVVGNLRVRARLEGKRLAPAPTETSPRQAKKKRRQERVTPPRRAKAKVKKVKSVRVSEPSPKHLTALDKALAQFGDEDNPAVVADDLEEAEPPPHESDENQETDHWAALKAVSRGGEKVQPHSKRVATSSAGSEDSLFSEGESFNGSDGTDQGERARRYQQHLDETIESFAAERRRLEGEMKAKRAAMEKSVNVRMILHASSALPTWTADWGTDKQARGLEYAEVSLPLAFRLGNDADPARLLQKLYKVTPGTEDADARIVSEAEALRRAALVRSELARRTDSAKSWIACMGFVKMDGSFDRHAADRTLDHLFPKEIAEMDGICGYTDEDVEAENKLQKSLGLNPMIPLPDVTAEEDPEEAAFLLRSQSVSESSSAARTPKVNGSAPEDSEASDAPHESSKSSPGKGETCNEDGSPAPKPESPASGRKETTSDTSSPNEPDLEQPPSEEKPEPVFEEGRETSREEIELGEADAGQPQLSEKDAPEASLKEKLPAELENPPGKVSDDEGSTGVFEVTVDEDFRLRKRRIVIDDDDENEDKSDDSPGAREEAKGTREVLKEKKRTEKRRERKTHVRSAYIDAQAELSGEGESEEDSDKSEDAAVDPELASFIVEEETGEGALDGTLQALYRAQTEKEAQERYEKMFTFEGREAARRQRQSVEAGVDLDDVADSRAMKRAEIRLGATDWRSEDERSSEQDSEEPSDDDEKENDSAYDELSYSDAENDEHVIEKKEGRKDQKARPKRRVKRSTRFSLLRPTTELKTQKENLSISKMTTDDVVPATDCTRDVLINLKAVLTSAPSDPE